MSTLFGKRYLALHPDTLIKLNAQFEHFSSGLLSIPVNLPGTKYRKGLHARKFIIQHFDNMMEELLEDEVEGDGDEQASMMQVLANMVDPDTGEGFGKEALLDIAVTILYAG